MTRVGIALGIAGFLSGCASAKVPQPQSTITVHGEAPRRPPSTGRIDTRPTGRVEEGLATWYGREQHGHLTANGEHFDMNALTAAHKTLRMHTRVRVTNKLNGRQVEVRINDRGPYAQGRIIDVSRAAAIALDMIDRGVVPVTVEILP